MFKFLLIIATSLWSVSSISTTYKCTGSTDAARRCKFSDLVYDTKDKSFTVARAVKSGDGTSFKLRTGLGANSYVLVKKKMMDNVLHENACLVTSATYFHTSHQIKSYGHMMRDNWHQIGLNMGDEVMDVVLLKDEGISRAAKHYSTYVTPVLKTMKEVEESCGGKRYIIFETSRMGNGDRDLRYAHKCNSSDIQKQRDRVMRHSGVVPTQADRYRVTILDKTGGDKRRLTNVGAVVSDLRQAFPQMDVNPMLFLSMNATHNLQIIADTDILITNIGSPSFRLLHLQDGARVIMVGAPSVGIETSKGVVTKLQKPFDEYDNCWKSLTHIKFYKYVVDDVSEVSSRFKRSDSARDDVVFVRDSDINLNSSKLIGIVHDILRDVKR